MGISQGVFEWLKTATIVAGLIASYHGYMEYVASDHDLDAIRIELRGELLSIRRAMLINLGRERLEAAYELEAGKRLTKDRELYIKARILEIDLLEKEMGR